MDKATTLQEVQTWPKEEQVNFLFSLWDSLVDSGWQPEVTQEMRAELDRRLATHANNPADVLTWEQVLSHVRRPR